MPTAGGGGAGVITDGAWLPRLSRKRIARSATGIRMEHVLAAAGARFTCCFEVNGG
jgi:hypothetical protein